MIFSNLGTTFQDTEKHFQAVINPTQTLSPATTKDVVKSILRLTDDDILSSGTYTTNNELDDLIMVATEHANKFTRFEHAQRNIEIRFDVHPFMRNSYDGLTPLGMIFSSFIELPINTVESITSVKNFDKEGNSEEITDFYHDLLSKPPRIKLEKKSVHHSCTLASLRIATVAGPGNVESKGYGRAVAQLAAYLYENSGCQITDAMKKSGAHELLKKYMIKRGL